jgi:energy-coupling factor transport system ATP-binding protein
VLKVEALEHVYPNGNQALHKIDLDIRAGDFFAIVGQNGSGKTTLVKHMNGLLPATKGAVIFQGKEINPHMVSELGRKIGFVFQNPDHQIFSSRVFDEVAFAPRNYGCSEQDVKQRVAKALELVELSGRENENPFLMTKGERQRLAIAGVLSADPELIILDEPTTGLDYAEQLKIMALLSELNRSGRTIVIITHTLWLVARYARNAAVMSHGRKILEGGVREVFSHPEILSQASLYPPEITRFGLELGFGFLSVAEARNALGAGQ